MKNVCGGVLFFFIIIIEQRCGVVDVKMGRDSWGNVRTENTPGLPERESKAASSRSDRHIPGTPFLPVMVRVVFPRLREFSL